MAFDPESAVIDEPSATGVFDPSSAVVESETETTGADVGQLISESNIKGMKDFFSQREPGIDYYSGVDKALVRAGFSRMNTDDEKNSFLTSKVGAKNYDKDSYGAWFIKPEGLKRLGIKSEVPISFDEQRVTLYDIADWAGDLPALIGATGYGMAASGLGALPGIGMAALGAAAGKAFDEIVKVFQGYKKGGAIETIADISGEAAASAAGEGLFRGGARALKGFSPRNLPERQAMTREAMEAGFTPKTWQMIEQGSGSLTKRFQATAERVLGDPVEEANRKAMERLISGMRARTPGEGELAGEMLIGKTKDVISAMTTSMETTKASAQRSLDTSLKKIQRSIGAVDTEVGARVAAEIKTGRKAFGDAASQMYQSIDDMAGQPIVPTTAIKEQAKQIASQLPRTEDGRVIFTKAGEANPIEDILNLPERITLSSAQRIRTMLREGSEIRDMVPGVDKRDLGMLKDAAENMFDDASQALGVSSTSPILDSAGKPITTTIVLPVGQAKAAIEALRSADAFYKQGIRKFDSPIVAAITKDASNFGWIEPDRVVDSIIKPGYSSAARRIKGLITEETWGKVARSHFDDIVNDSTVFLDGKELVDGKKLYGKIKSLGNTVEVVYGKDASSIRQYASELAARDGLIDPSLLSGNIAQSLKVAAKTRERLDRFMGNNYLKELAKEGAEAEQAVDFVFRPESSTRIRKAKEFFGETSTEFMALQNRAMDKILANMVERTKDPLIQIFNGAALRSSLDKYGKNTLRETFGNDITADLYKFANLAEFVTKQGPGGAGGIVAASVALRPLNNVGKIVEMLALGRILRTPGAIKWLSEGISADTPTKQAAASLARVSLLATALVGDETGSATVNATPELVDQTPQ